MKITKRQLRRIIREEKARLLRESQWQDNYDSWIAQRDRERAEELDADKRAVYEKGYRDGQRGHDFSSSYRGRMRQVYLDGHLAGAEGL